MLTAPVPIEEQSLYDDAFLVIRLGYSLDALAKARRVGRLRHVRRGGRPLYLGSWLLTWLESEAKEGAGRNNNAPRGQGAAS
jgi:hypothetical protein